MWSPASTRGRLRSNTEEATSRVDLGVVGLTPNEVDLVRRSASETGLITFGDNRVLALQPVDVDADGALSRLRSVM